MLLLPAHALFCAEPIWGYGGGPKKFKMFHRWVSGNRERVYLAEVTARPRPISARTFANAAAGRVIGVSARV